MPPWIPQRVPPWRARGPVENGDPPARRSRGLPPFARRPRDGTPMRPLPTSNHRPLHGRPMVGVRRARRRWFGAHRPLAHRPDPSRLRRRRACVRRNVRSAADRPVRAGGIGGRLRELLRPGLPPGAQQHGQRYQNTRRSQKTPASHGNTHATSICGGSVKPDVILHNPQRRHTLQGPADHPGLSRRPKRPPFRTITGPPKSFVNFGSITTHFFAPSPIKC